MFTVSRPSRAVHLWRLDLKPPEPVFLELSATLSPDEQERAGAFYFDSPRGRYVAARGFLRTILAAYLAIAPADVTFIVGPHGKPALAQGGLQFNLSHSGDLGLIGITDLPAIGVDVEMVRPIRDLRAIARRFFAPGEVSRLLALPAAEQERAFFRCWTRKEAFIKALGTGFSTPLDSFEVTFAGTEPARLLTISDDEAEARAWSLRNIDVGPQAAAAVAVRAQEWRLIDCGVAPHGPVASPSETKGSQPA